MYTALNLITDSYYLSQVLSEELETISGYESTRGLTLLNDFLAVKTSDSRMIPYTTVYDMDLETGEELYYIPNLVKVDSFTFFINTVRFASQELTQNQYFASPRVNDIVSLPFSWNQQRVLDGTNIRVYFSPQADYTVQIVGKFSLTEIPTLQFDFSAIYERFYIVYIKYGLAIYICNFYNQSVSPDLMREYKSLEARVLGITPMDLSLNKVSSFSSKSPYNWGDVNLGRGWRP